MQIFTIGHSTHSSEHFVRLLQKHGVQTLVDVRSIPASRRMPWFARQPLGDALREAGIRYVWMGDRLGGKQQSPPVSYAEVRGTERFKQGMNTLEHTAAESATAVMCAEEDPMHCHRWLMLGPAMQERGIDVRHIRGDGRVERAMTNQPQLF